MTAEELEDLIGTEAAFLFLSRQGGQRYIVPKRLSPRIVDHMGETAATKFVREFGGCYVNLPSAKPWRAKQLHARGMSVSQISLALCMTTRGVRYALRDVTRENALQAASQDASAA